MIELQEKEKATAVLVGIDRFRTREKTEYSMRELENIFDTEVMDRTGLILQIFSKRARTKEAKLQVESAQLKYLLPRLVGMRKNLSRQGGCSGRLSNKGAGEKQIELDRRRI